MEKMNRKKICLIDTENVTIETVKEIINTERKNLKVYLFYTKNSGRIRFQDLLSFIANADKIEMISCNTGTNALDFQLVSYAEFLIHSFPKSEYIIVSNDKGYDPCIDFWKEKGILISLESENKQLPTLKNLNPAQKKEYEDRIKKCVDLLDEILGNNKGKFKVFDIAEVFILTNPEKSKICPGLFKAIGTKNTAEFIHTIGKENLKKLYKM